MTFQRLRDKSMPRPEKRPQDSRQECSLSLLCFCPSFPSLKFSSPSCPAPFVLSSGLATRSRPYLVSSVPLLLPLPLSCRASQTLHWCLLQMEWAAACPSQDTVLLIIFSRKCPWLVKIRWRSHKKEEDYTWLGGQKLGPNGSANEVGGCSASLPAAIPESSTQLAAAS